MEGRGLLDGYKWIRPVDLNGDIADKAIIQDDRMSGFIDNLLLLL